MVFGNIASRFANFVRTKTDRLSEAIKTNPTQFEDGTLDDAIKPKESWIKRNITDKFSDTVNVITGNRAARNALATGTAIKQGQSPLNALTREHNPKVSVNVRVKLSSTGEFRNFLYNMTESEYQDFINDPDQFIRDRLDEEEKYLGLDLSVQDWS